MKDFNALLASTIDDSNKPSLLRCVAMLVVELRKHQNTIWPERSLASAVRDGKLADAMLTALKRDSRAAVDLMIQLLYTVLKSPKRERLFPQIPMFEARSQTAAAAAATNSARLTKAKIDFDALVRGEKAVC